jgi:hypothetical protein
LTIERWSRRRTDFDLVVSQVVLDEVQMGDPSFAKSRLEVVASLPRLLLLPIICTPEELLGVENAH